MLKNIIILSEPRSGSHWFQSCFPNHYSFGEFLNVRNIPAFELRADRAYPGTYKEASLSQDEELRLLSERLSTLENFNSPFSVKVHLFHVQGPLVSWLEKQEAQIYCLRRRDRLEALKSLMIANHLKQFSGALPQTEITVSNQNFLESSKLLYDFKDYVPQTRSAIEFVYYEDLLQRQKSENFDPSNSWMTRQQSSRNVSISNWTQLEIELKRNPDFKNHFFG